MNLLVGFMLIISEGNELDTFYLLISNFSSTFIKRKKLIVQINIKEKDQMMIIKIILIII